jgi:outer membrane receptor protein involved in Fe transport
MPSVSDTLTKVVGTHTLKAGFFWEWIRNAQPANNDTNGQLQFVSGSNPLYSSGDSYADEVLGIASHYDEATKNRINDIAYNTYDFFVQDDWKLTKRLTVNYGLRFSHVQPWILVAYQGRRQLCSNHWIPVPVALLPAALGSRL